ETELQRVCCPKLVCAGLQGSEPRSTRKRTGGKANWAVGRLQTLVWPQHDKQNKTSTPATPNLVFMGAARAEATATVRQRQGHPRWNDRKGSPIRAGVNR